MYPPVSFYFSVRFEGLTGTADAQFQEVSGLQAEVSTEQVEEGGENRFVQQLPTRGKYANLVLKRGMSTTSQLRTWITNAIEHFVFDPKNLSVFLLDEDGVPLVSWTFVNAYPVKWAASDLKAQENALLIESLELSYQYFHKAYLQ